MWSASAKNLTMLLNDALNEPVMVTVTETARRRKITKREAVIKQFVNKSASAAGGPGGEEVLAQLEGRLEGTIRDEINPVALARRRAGSASSSRARRDVNRLSRIRSC